MSRKYHALTTHYNVYFNGKESLKEGLKKMERSHEEDFTQILPVFFSNNPTSRSIANGNMTRVIEKASKAIKVHSITRKPKRKKGKRSDKYKEFRKKKEFNDWIDDCYLLLGKGYFFKKDYHGADKTFKFILREYPKSDLRNEAQLWLVRSLVDQNEFSGAKEQLARLDQSGMSSAMRTELACIKADLFIRQQQYDNAIPAIQQAIAGENKKYHKARYKYILAQLYQKTGQDAAASNTFRELGKMSFSYEMTFNARISRALSYDGSGNGEEIRKELRKMARDRKNKEFRDQIYYAFGEMDMKDENPEEAIENYWLSTQKSMGNDNQKALSFLRLGEYYFEQLNYKKSQLCYDSSMVYLRQDYPEYEVLSQRVRNLTELVNNLNVVEREDSLQNVARMSPKDRDLLIAGIIQKIVEEEEQKRRERDEAMQDRAFFNQNNMMGRTHHFYSGISIIGRLYMVALLFQKHHMRFQQINFIIHPKYRNCFHAFKVCVLMSG
jgi:tetratricopeptide (TPR) repeat protein